MRVPVQSGDGGVSASQAGVADVPIGAVSPIATIPTWAVSVPYYKLGAALVDALTAGFTKDILYAFPFTVSRNGIINSLAIRCSTGVATSVVHFGLYNADPVAMFPTTLIVDSGEFSIAATPTTPIVAVSVPVVVGTWYWAVSHIGVADTPQFIALPNNQTTPSPIGVLATAFGSVPSAHLRVATAYAALPAVFPTANVTPNNNGCPAIFARFGNVQ